MKKPMKTNLRKLVTPAFVLIAAALLLSQSRLSAQQNIVQNGSFDVGWENNSIIDWGYTYNEGLDEGCPDADADGCYAEVYGTLFQDLQTVPGQTYQLQFALSGISVPSTLDVLWGGESIGSVSWSPAGHNADNMGWVWFDFDVTASSSSTQLAFDNPFLADGSGRIPDLDAVTVEAVPEPESLWLLGFGLLAIFARGQCSVAFASRFGKG